MKLLLFGLSIFCVMPLTGMSSLHKKDTDAILLLPDDTQTFQKIKEKLSELSVLKFNELNALAQRDIIEAQSENSKEHIKIVVESNLCTKLVKEKEKEVRDLMVEYPIDHPKAQEFLLRIQSYKRFDHI